MSNKVFRLVLLKEDVDTILIITAITCSMLESPSTYDNDEMKKVVSKSNFLEPTIKHWRKETIFWHRVESNLVRRGQNTKEKYP